ncbi:MAG: sensor domain-containing diguanylate cyclase [Gemmatimonadaceae bacterium]|nr:sensor domain-containing diguanylate cyclase [Gemmatimonadaceae bacterium]
MPSTCIAPRGTPRPEPFAVAPGLTVETHVARLTSPSRLAALEATGLLDGSANDVLDRLTRLATRLLKVPIALVSLVDDRSQHFPGQTGLGGWAGDQRGTSLSYSFCQHVVATDRPLLVEGAGTNPLVRNNLAFSELGVQAYLGVPLRTSEGETLGSFCAIDSKRSHWTPEQVATLEDLAAAAMAEIELRATTRALIARQAELEAAKTALQAANDRLQVQAVRDPLTGLLNRRGFAELARQHLATARRLGSPAVVAVMDLDGFKQINDTLGHDVGDEALVEMAALLKKTCRDSDLVARLGGDEFALLLTNTTETCGAVVRERLETALASLNAEPEREYRLASSMGMVSWIAEAPVSMAVLLKEADAAMYADKRARKELVGAQSAEATE